MPLTRDQIEALRPLVENEPEGSPARHLLAHVDEVEAERRAREREHNVVFLKRDGHSDEAIERIFAAVERGMKLEDETVTCPSCKGGGHAEGSFLKRCPQCYGQTKIIRIKAPDEPAIVYVTQPVAADELRASDVPRGMDPDDVVKD